MDSTERATREQVEERVDIIEGLMRRAAWDRGRTSRQLAKQWNCSVAAVNDYAAEAGRRVRKEVTDADGVQTTVCAALSTVMREGLRDGDRASVIRAGDVWTRIAGARAPDRHEVTVVDEYERLSSAERAKWCRDKAAELLAVAEEEEREPSDDPSCPGDLE